MGFADDINRFLDREVKRVVNTEVSRIASDTQRTSQAIFDRLVRDHGGEPVEACIPHVRAAFAEAELTPDDDAEVLGIAESVSAGERIVMNVATDVRW